MTETEWYLKSDLSKQMEEHEDNSYRLDVGIIEMTGY